ncbi:hypothetical protein [Halostella salina]|uniref:hypothetical protein n=1 Tax=Halostella salina TaxID=1547897 RepID=UPI000EF852EF|nr:hypothetical protein [Halostella salina]
MGQDPVAVVDTNVLLNLATPVVDGRPDTPSGEDPFRTVLTAYDVHVPETVLGEVAEAAGDDDLLSAAANAVLAASGRLTAHDVVTAGDDPLEYGLDPGESMGIRLANEIGADLFVTDEFNTSNYLLVAMALDDRNTLFTTPHILCGLADRDILDTAYVDGLLTYLCKSKSWDEQYVDQLRARYLRD